MALKEQRKVDKQIAELAKRFEKEMSATFLAAVRNITDEVILSDLINAIRSGDFEAAVRILSLESPAFRSLEQKVADAFETGGQVVAASVPRLRDRDGVRAVFRFDVRNERAERWLRQHSGLLVTRIVDDTRTAIRNRLQDGMIAGQNPRTVALDIIGRISARTGRREGGIIGLTAPQEQWVRNARRELVSGVPDQLQSYLGRKMRDKRFDSYVRAAIAEEKPVNVKVVEKIIGRYNDNLLRLRGETIGRKEMIETLNRAQWEGYNQAIGKGIVQQQAVLKVWDTAGDKRVRHSHAELDGDSVGVDEPFLSPATGDAMMFPGDSSLGASGEDTINCRCRVRYKVDFFRGVD